VDSHSAMLTIFSFFVGLSMANAQSSAPEVVPGEYIVKFRPMTVPEGALNKVQNKISMKGSFPQMNMFHISLKGSSADVSTIEELAQDPDVEYIEPNFVLKKSDFDDRAGLGAPAQVYSASEVQALDQVSSSSATFSQNGAQTKVSEAWAIESTSSSYRPIVAIIDTGLDKSHPVFVNTNSLWVNTREVPGNGIDDDYNGYIDDVNGWNFISNTADFNDDDGHGTHVAGIVVGTGMNIFATPLNETSKMRVMPLKFLDANGSGTTSNAIRAVYYAVNNGARVINNSWGGSSYSRALHEAMTFAYSNRAFIASAAGNNGKSNDAVSMYPANYDVPSNVSVAATSDFDYMASFSNYGSRSVHIASPGVMILSTLPNNRTGTMSGTSMATPFVAGMAALAMREAPYLTGFQVKDIMLAKATLIQSLLGKVSTSARINSYNLIVEAKLQANIQASQPDYSPVYQADARGLASEASPPKAGCGLVSAALMKGPGNNTNGFNGMGVLAGLFLLPVIVWTILRQRALEKQKTEDPVSRRKFDRFKMSSDIRLMVGDRELSGSLKTISLGGASFCAEEALEKGGIITMKIASPDGRDLVEVSGQVVWSEANQSYGVQFAGAEQSTLAMIQKWTNGLMKV